MNNTISEKVTDSKTPCSERMRNDGSQCACSSQRTIFTSEEVAGQIRMMTDVSSKQIEVLCDLMKGFQQVLSTWRRN